MVTPEMGNRLPPHGYFAIDNGCFAHPDTFSMEKYERYVTRLLATDAHRCLFVTAPDVPFDADGTVARFEQYGARTKALGAPVAFITQDGMGVEDVPWSDIDALFVGGSTAWKTGYESGALLNRARERGVWTHMGRVNSYSRYRAAETMGCDSADGTFLAFGPDANWPRLRGWLEHPQQAMVIA